MKFFQILTSVIIIFLIIILLFPIPSTHDCLFNKKWGNNNGNSGNSENNGNNGNSGNNKTDTFSNVFSYPTANYNLCPTGQTYHSGYCVSNDLISNYSSDFSSSDPQFTPYQASPQNQLCQLSNLFYSGLSSA